MGNTAMPFETASERRKRKGTAFTERLLHDRYHMGDEFKDTDIRDFLPNPEESGSDPMRIPKQDIEDFREKKKKNKPVRI